MSALAGVASSGLQCSASNGQTSTQIAAVHAQRVVDREPVEHVAWRGRGRRRGPAGTVSCVRVDVDAPVRALAGAEHAGGAVLLEQRDHPAAAGRQLGHGGPHSSGAGTPGGRAGRRERVGTGVLCGSPGSFAPGHGRRPARRARSPCAAGGPERRPAAAAARSVGWPGEVDAEHLVRLALVPAAPANSPATESAARAARAAAGCAAASTVPGGRRRDGSTSRSRPALVDGGEPVEAACSPSVVPGRGHRLRPRPAAGRRRSAGRCAAVDRRRRTPRGRGQPGSRGAAPAAAPRGPQQRLGPGRAAGHVHVDRQHLVDALGHAVGVPVRPAGVGAGRRTR